MSGCVAIVVAAGRGHRFGGEMPKQYRSLAGVPVVRHTLRALLAHPRVEAVRPVIHMDDIDLFAAAAHGLEVLDPVKGGATRQQSVLLGLESVAAMEPDYVLIHDAARPVVGEDVISGVLAALETSPGAIPALAVSDTLKRSDDGEHIAATVERSGLWRAQTPQGFRFAEILQAHRRFAGQQLTDDAAVAEKAGLAVALTAGGKDNVKITTEDDLARIARLFGGENRTGFGIDAHRFGPGDHVMLCGVAIPFDNGLEGHSDADVGLHALTDALLGSIGGGDIGDHFPPGDDTWKDAPSEIFLKKAAQLAAESGATISNLDVTLVCEKPKIGPHRAAMVERIAEILGIDAGRVSVKATTTEKMGFAGRGEGIVAQAVASVTFHGGIPSCKT